MAGEICMLRSWDHDALQAQRRVLHAVAKDIQQRYQALQLPQELALPQLTGRRSQDRDYAEMGTQLLAMLAAIDQARADAVKVTHRHAPDACRVIVTTGKEPVAAGSQGQGARSQSGHLLLDACRLMFNMLLANLAVSNQATASATKKGTCCKM